MADFPALPLFTDAYIADTAHLTNEEHGVYLRLLMFAWRTKSCSLPDNDARLALMVGATKGKWTKLKPIIMSFWELDNGEWTQKKLTKQRDFVAKQREQKRIAGDASAKARALKTLNTSPTAVATADITAGQQPIPTPIPTPITTDKKDTKVSTKKPPIKKLVFDILSKVAGTDAVNGFIEMRWSVKAPMTERAAGLLADKLRGRMNADAILDLSTENNWKTVYPDSTQLNGGQSNGARTNNFTSNREAENTERLRYIIETAAEGTSAQDWDTD